jgi:hypothetical protein
MEATVSSEENLPEWFKTKKKLKEDMEATKIASTEKEVKEKQLIQTGKEDYWKDLVIKLTAVGDLLVQLGKEGKATTYSTSHVRIELLDKYAPSRADVNYSGHEVTAEYSTGDAPVSLRFAVADGKVVLQDAYASTKMDTDKASERLLHPLISQIR